MPPPAAPAGRTARPRPPAPSREHAHAGISSAAVLKATGRPWNDWFKTLDRFDVKANGHKAAAAFLHDTHHCPPWWSQMIVVGYEQARGLRVKHQKSDGFSVSASRVINAPAAAAFRALTDARQRTAWLTGVTLDIRKAVAPKSVRFTVTSGPGLKPAPARASSLDVNISARAAARCQVAIQHDRLPDARAAARFKTFWAAAADRLKASLED